MPTMYDTSSVSMSSASHLSSDKNCDIMATSSNSLISTTRVKVEDNAAQTQLTGSRWPTERTLPEIWMKIFLHTLPPSYNFSDPIRNEIKITDSRLAPLLLASVCQEWRSIVYHTAELWETCWLNYFHPEANELWLQRSGSRPLNLCGQKSWRTSTKWEQQGREAMSIAFFNSFLPYQRRWKFLKLHVGPIIVEESLANKMFNSVNAPLLEVLQLCGDKGSRTITNLPLPYNPAWAKSILSNAPVLRQLALRTVFDMDLDEHTFPFLTDLAVEIITIPKVLWLLQKLPKLRRLAVDISDRWTDTVFPLVTHENLVYLGLTDALDGTSLLTFLNLPLLRDLNISDTKPAAVLDFLDRSNCRLTCFRIGRNFLISNMQLTSILEHKGFRFSLETLELAYFPINAHLLRFLQYDPKNPQLIYLERLSIEDCAIIAQEGLLAECVASRCNSRICEWEEKEMGLVRRQVRLKSLFANIGSSRTLDIACMVPLVEPTYWPDEWTGEIEIWRNGKGSKVLRVLLGVPATLNGE